MYLNELLIEAHKLLDAATVNDGMGELKLCMASLVELRGLLNEQPELEAGGACESVESSDG